MLFSKYKAHQLYVQYYTVAYYYQYARCMTLVLIVNNFWSLFYFLCTFNWYESMRKRNDKQSVDLEHSLCSA